MTHQDAPATAEGIRAWSTATMAALFVVVVLGLILGWTGRGAALNVNGDDPIYLSLSHSLAHGNYRDEYLVGTPPHAQYPPGMPLWLMLVRVLAGGSLDAALAGNLLLLVITALLLADAVRRLGTPWLGVTAAAVVLVNPALLYLAAELRSELPYLACCSLALWCSLVDGKRTGRWLSAVTIAAAIAAFLTRSAGIALLPAIGWAFLLRRRWKPLIASGILFTAVTAGWFAYTRWAGQRTIGHTYATDLSASAHVGEPTRLLSHALSIATAYFGRLANTQFGIPDIPDFPIDNGLWGLLLLIPVAVGAWSLSRRWLAMVTFLLLSIGVLLVFPWPVQRLLTVLLPWFVALFLIGFVHLSSRIGSLRGEVLAVAVGVILVGFGVAAQAQVSRRATACRASAPYVDSRCYSPPVRSFVAAATFIRDSLPANAVIAASKPSIIYHLTHRFTFPLELFDRPGSFLAPEGPATVILLSRLFPYEAKHLAPRLLHQCPALTLYGQFAEGTLVLGPAPQGANPGNDACRALAEYVKATPADFGDDSE